MRRTFQGSLVAMVTPFRDGRVDEAKLRELVEFHVATGRTGSFPAARPANRPPSPTRSTSASSRS